MFSKAFTSFAIVASIVVVAGSPAPAPVSPCAAVHIIAARASTELPGAGIIGALVEQVQKESSQTVSTSNVDYPALLFPYATSSASGTAATKTLLTNQANNCPNQKIVLVGYSQGAHIIGDAVAGGGGGALGATTAPVSASIANRVVAIVQMGDPRHVSGKSYNRGTSRNQGLYARLSSQEYSATLQPRILNFCDSGDTFCDSGIDTIAHLTYLSRYQDTAANFILSQIGG
ncbi:cutinase [Crassisporium funariophilum]|nr:cutinase [Crassisporium funariophilum]KAF8160053.1 cutinase [Crassisporium funariophilum]